MAKVLIQDLADLMSSSFGNNSADAQLFVRTFFETIVKGLERDKFVRLKGFGTFKMVEVDDRESINVNTGERFMIQGHAKVSFIPDTVLKDLINKPFAHFETVVLSEETTDMALQEVDKKFDVSPKTESDAESENDADLEIEPESVPVTDPESESGSKPVEDSEPVPEPESMADPEPVTVPEVVLEPEQDESATVEVSAQPAITEQVVTEDTVPEPEPVSKEVLIHVAEQSEPTGEEEKKSKYIHLKLDTIKVKGLPENYAVIWGAMWLACLLLGYMLGYFHLFTPAEPMKRVIVHDTIIQEKIMHDTIWLNPDSLKIQQETDIPAVETKQPKVKEEPAKSFSIEQASEVDPKIKMAVKNGQFMIVGNQGTHVLQTGETLRIIAEEHYGSRNLANYIIVYNNLKDPNNVAVGTVIQLPKLQRKNK